MQETQIHNKTGESASFSRKLQLLVLPTSDQRLGGFLDRIFNQRLVMSKPESENRPSLSFTPHEFFQGLIIASGQGFVCVCVWVCLSLYVFMSTIPGREK